MFVTIQGGYEVSAFQSSESRVKMARSATILDFQSLKPTFPR